LTLAYKFPIKQLNLHAIKLKIIALSPFKTKKPHQI